MAGLRKTAVVTVIPEVAGRAYSAASHTCIPVPPPGTGGDTDPPDPPIPGGDVVPEPGTPILLEYADGLGGYSSVGGVAPAPSGFACRYETVNVYAPGDPTPVTTYHVVCTQTS